MGSEWREVKLEDVARELTVGYVGSMTSEYVKSGIPFLRSKNVDTLNINTGDLKYISGNFHKKIGKSRLPPEMLLLYVQENREHVPLFLIGSRRQIVPTL